MPCEYDVDDIVPLLLVKQEQSFENRFTVGFFGPKYFLFVVFIENGEEPREGGRQAREIPFPSHCIGAFYSPLVQFHKTINSRFFPVD